MAHEINSQYFSDAAVKSGDMAKFIQILMDQCYPEDCDFKLYNDIHIRPEDCGAFVVEWSQEPWDQSYGGRFQYVGEDQAVRTEYEFPDEHYEYLSGDDEYEERLDEFLAEEKARGIEWVKSEFGRWVDKAQEERWRKMLEADAKERAEYAPSPEDGAEVEEID
jgi:hypothetical protein